ncbi:MAG TPA: tetratricopeptide repeat protein [Vicinamibacterales bacterium]
MGRSRGSRKDVPAGRMVSDARSGFSWRAAVIVSAGFLAYSNSLSGPFVFDDQLSIVENPSIRRWWPLSTVLFPERELPVAGRPLVNLSFALNYAGGGLEVFGYHLVNVTLHLMCALLVFGLVRRTLEMPIVNATFPRQSTNLAFAAALLWTLHPLTTEAVNYVTQRTELMMAFCYLLTLYASARAWQHVHPHRTSTPLSASRAGVEGRWQAAAIASCAAGMACKESMATAPLIVVVHDAVFRFGSLKRALATRWRFYAGLALSWVLLAALMWSGPRIHSAGFSSGVSPWAYLLNQTVMITQYLQLAVWPRSLVANYGWPVAMTLGDVLPYALLVVVLLALTTIALIRCPALGFLGAWFFVTLAPTSSVVPIATEVGAERRMYLPLVALIVLAVVALARITRTRPAATAAAVLACAAALAAGTVTRNRDYGSGLRLARTAVERRPTGVAHHVLGTELLKAGLTDEAMVHLRQAVDGAPRARFTLGVQLLNQGETSAAIEELQRFLREQPLLLEAVSARQLLGQAFARQQQWPQAIEQYRRVLTMNPSRVQRHETEALLGTALVRAEHYEEALALYRRYLVERPADVDALTNVGIALVATNKLEDALGAFRRAVELDPRNGDMRRNLAAALFDHREIDEAAVHAEQAVALQPADPTAHDLFGRILAVQGNLTEARAQFERALQMAPDFRDARENLAKLERLMAGRH